MDRARARERSFDMPLSDLGETHEDAGEFSNLDGTFAKWIVQEAAGGSRLPKIIPMKGDDAFYTHVEGHESEPHEAEVHFTAKSLDGTVLSSSRENDIPLTFNLTQGDVIEGFRLAISLMKAGEKAVFTIPEVWSLPRDWDVTPDLRANIPWNIPRHETVRFDIELISLITDIFGDQGIKKKTIKFGTGYKLPLDLDEVLVKYNACLEDGASVSKSEGVEFSLAEGFFCSAFAHVVKTMTKGEEAIVVIKPKYAFGEQGRPSTGNETAVPPNATLHVNLQLISWKIVTHIGENREIVKRRLCNENKKLGRRPRNGAVVKVWLIGKLQDGTVFDRRGHNGDDPLEFTIGEEHVVYGLEEAVMTMEEGEVASFTIPPQHAFGAVGSNQYPLADIPPNSVVIYEIKLLSVVNVLKDDPGNPKALQVTAQSFPETTVEIDAHAMHRGLEEELKPPGWAGAANEGSSKYTEKPPSGRAFCTPFTLDSLYLYPPLDGPVGCPAPGRFKFLPSFKLRKKLPRGRATERKRKASLLCSCFGSSSSK